MAELIAANEALRASVDSRGDVMTFLFLHDRVLTQDDEQLGFSLANLAMELTRLAHESRERRSGARCPNLDRGDLEGALRRTVAQQQRNTTTPIELANEGNANARPADVEDELVRITGEALGNAIRHASARRVVVTLAHEPGTLRLVVADDGRGFDPDHVTGAGLGLVGIRERAQPIGAEVTFFAEPGGGTDVIVFWRDPALPPRAT